MESMVVHCCDQTTNTNPQLPHKTTKCCSITIEAAALRNKSALVTGAMASTLGVIIALTVKLSHAKLMCLIQSLHAGREHRSPIHLPLRLWAHNKSLISSLVHVNYLLAKSLYICAMLFPGWHCSRLGGPHGKLRMARGLLLYHNASIIEWQTYYGYLLNGFSILLFGECRSLE